MKPKYYALHPASMYLISTIAIAVLSWIFDIYELSAVRPDTGENIRVQSLLSPEGIRWALRHAVTNFTDFAPLGMVVVAMFGIGLVQHSGFMEACIRKWMGNQRRPRSVVLGIIVTGLLFNVIGDTGYIVLLPIAAILFSAVGLHPMGGIIVGYVSVACGYSANIFISTMDPIIAATTQEAANRATLSAAQAGPLCNYYFFAASTLLLAVVIYWITCKVLLPSLGEYKKDGGNGGSLKKLSHKENRAMSGALCVGIIYWAIILWGTFSPWGILRGVGGGLLRSPFIAGALFLFSVGMGLMGVVYGFASGRYRKETDVVDGFIYPMRLLGIYLVITFFASQMFAFFDYSQIDECIVIISSEIFSTIDMCNWGVLISFIFFVALINLVMVSATSKWAVMSYLFIPILTSKGIAPDMVQCAFRIGDSATNAITPFMFYLPFVLACMEKYDKSSNYISLLKYTWKYSIAILLAWIMLFIIWRIIDLPLGL